MRLITLGIAIPVTLAVAACGGGGTSQSASRAAASHSSATTVSVRQLPGVGSVLVDHSGQALYSSDLEASGKIVCTAACNSFWTPVTVSAGKPTASPGAGKLGVISRPDGSKQVTDGGKPLYTFAQDSPGKATGNGFHDEFNGHRFTWNVVRAGGKPASSGGSSSGAGTGGGSYSSGSGGGGYSSGGGGGGYSSGGGY